MQFQWALHNYYSIVMRTITLHAYNTCRCTRKLYKSNNITKLLTELSWAIEVMDKNNECNYYLYYYYNIKVNKVLAL